MAIGAIGGSNPYTNRAPVQRNNSAIANPVGLSKTNGMDAKINNSNKNTSNASPVKSGSSTPVSSSGEAESTLQRLKELANQANKVTGRSEDKSGQKTGVTSNALNNLGVKGLDATKGIDMKAVDDAIVKVADARKNETSPKSAFDSATKSLSGRISNIKSSMTNIETDNTSQAATKLNNVKSLEQYKAQVQLKDLTQNNQIPGMVMDFKF